MQDSGGAETEEVRLLRAYFAKNGMLLCNENKELPSLFSVGGDWNAVVSLLEQGEVYYCKLYKGRTTYLSRALYYQIKPYKQNLERLSQKGREVLAFIKAAGLVSTKEIKDTLMLPRAAYTACMDELFKALLACLAYGYVHIDIGERWRAVLWRRGLSFPCQRPLHWPLLRTGVLRGRLYSRESSRIIKRRRSGRLATSPTR